MLCHLVLGLGLSLAPIGAYLAVTARFDLLPVLFSFTVLFWVSGFDIIYALQDEEFDRVNQLHSIPATMGKKSIEVFRSIARVVGLYRFLCRYPCRFWHMVLVRNGHIRRDAFISA